MEERSKPFLVSFNHFFLVSGLVFGTNFGLSLFGDGGPEPAKHPIHSKIILCVKSVCFKLQIHVCCFTSMCHIIELIFLE